jgi:hypothetical protein
MTGLQETKSAGGTQARTTGPVGFQVASSKGEANRDRGLVPPAAAATAVAAATTATAAAAAAIFAGTGFVDGQRATFVLLVVQTLDGFAGGIVIRHFDKAEPLAAAGIAVHDDLGALDRTILGKQRL